VGVAVTGKKKKREEKRIIFWGGSDKLEKKTKYPLLEKNNNSGDLEDKM